MDPQMGREDEQAITYPDHLRRLSTLLMERTVRTGISLGVPRTQYTRIILLFPLQSKPGLSLKTRTFRHSRECEGDRAALVLDSLIQAIP